LSDGGGGVVARLAGEAESAVVVATAEEAAGGIEVILIGEGSEQAGEEAGLALGTPGVFCGALEFFETGLGVFKFTAEGGGGFGESIEEEVGIGFEGGPVTVWLIERLVEALVFCLRGFDGVDVLGGGGAVGDAVVLGLIDFSAGIFDLGFDVTEDPGGGGVAFAVVGDHLVEIVQGGFAIVEQISRVERIGLAEWGLAGFGGGGEVCENVLESVLGGAHDLGVFGDITGGVESLFKASEEGFVFLFGFADGVGLRADFGEPCVNIFGEIVAAFEGSGGGEDFTFGVEVLGVVEVLDDFGEGGFGMLEVFENVFSGNVMTGRDVSDFEGGGSVFLGELIEDSGVVGEFVLEFGTSCFQGVAAGGIGLPGIASFFD
jgi:hypothetical protein